jgi:hypothetical protein
MKERRELRSKGRYIERQIGLHRNEYKKADTSTDGWINR